MTDDKTSTKKCVRVSRLFCDGVPIQDPTPYGMTMEEARQFRLNIMRHPCECGALDGILITADIDLKERKVIKWEMAFSRNLMDIMDTEYVPPRLWFEVKYCPVCGKPLRTHCE